MKIRISDKIISYPPYISTTWENVKSLNIETFQSGIECLVITLNDGYKVKIPELDEKLLQMIFAAHLRYIDQQTPPISQNQTQNQVLGIPLKLGFGGIEGLGAALQHNQAQANTAPLPQEVINKITGIAKLMSAEEAAFLPKAEPHCNCLHCQLARAMQRGLSQNEEIIAEEITEEDLRFRLWDVSQNGDKLYIVKNPLDHQEQYSVFLGDPIGCTCGQKNCEHIKAVLNS